MPHGLRASRPYGMSVPEEALKPDSKKSLAFSLAAAGAGALAAAVLPGADGPGLGIPLVALAVAGSVALLAGSSLNAHTVAFSIASLLLTFVAMFRAAEWVVMLDLLFAVALSSYALAGGSSWWATVRGMIGAGFRLHRAPGFLFGPLINRRSGERPSGVGSIVRGSAAAGVLLLIFGALFLAADTAFAQIASNVMESAIPDVGTLPPRIFLGLVIALFATSLVLASPRFAPTGSIWSGELVAGWSRPKEGASDKPASSRWEWLIPLAALDLLFAVFVLVQLAVLFGGRDHVLETAGLTYAEYARSGFFQLVAVAALTLLVVGIFRAWVGSAAPNRDERLARVLLGVLCVLTLVVLASALRRIGLYEDAFGLTRLRLFVHGVILWLGAVFALVLLAGAFQGKWLPRSLVALTTVALLVFTAINPDATIAERNVERYEATGKIDVCFLSTLSADAVPALLELPPQLAADATSRVSRNLAKPGPWFAWNLGRERARDRLDLPQGLITPTGCYDFGY